SGLPTVDCRRCPGSVSIQWIWSQKQIETQPSRTSLLIDRRGLLHCARHSKAWFAGREPVGTAAHEQPQRASGANAGSSKTGGWTISRRISRGRVGSEPEARLSESGPNQEG